MNPLRKTEIRKLAIREMVRKILKSIISEELDIYEGYRTLYKIWCSNNAAVQELRPLFRITGISPDGMLSVTEEFRQQVVSISREILSQISNETKT